MRALLSIYEQLSSQKWRFFSICWKMTLVKNFSHLECRIFYSVLLGLLFGVLPVVLCAQTQLTNITASNGSIVFSFSSLPAEVSSELSDDKKRIAITFANTIAANKLHDDLPTTEQIEHIAVQQKGKALTAYIILRDKYGFTQVALPYSRAVQVSIVQWDKLPQRDNLYHSGLLSLDSKLPETALDYFQQASQKGSGNAAAVAGLIALQHGDIEKAQANFTRAIDIGTSIHDVYAAVSDIAAARGDTQRAQHFAQLFTRKTRLSSFAPLVPAILANESEVLEPRTLAQHLLSGDLQTPLPAADSAVAAAPDSTAADTLLNQQVSDQAQALITTPRDEGTASSPSFVPSWMQWAVYGFLFVFCAGFVGILYLYLRWRKKHLRTSTAPTATAQPSAFEQEMATALQTAQAKRASNLYKQAENAGTEEHGEEQQEQEEELSPANDISNTTVHMPLYAPDEELADIEAPTPVHDTTMAQQPTDTDEVDTLARKLRKGRGELDLAVKLMARKKQDGQGKALDIPADDIPEKPSHLARFAQKLGIGAGLLEMRRQLGTSIHNEKEEKLRSLFDTSNREK